MKIFALKLLCVKLLLQETQKVIVFLLNRFSN